MTALELAGYYAADSPTLWITMIAPIAGLALHVRGHPKGPALVVAGAQAGALWAALSW